MKFLCQEKGGDIEREVSLFSPTIENVVVLVDKIQTVPNFLDPKLPYTVFMAPENTFFLVDDVGVLAVVDPVPGEYAHVHMTFWDRRLRGRERMCRELIEWVLQVGQYRFLFTAVPEAQKTVEGFVKRVGFRDLGCKKGVKAFSYEGRLYGNR